MHFPCLGRFDRTAICEWRRSDETVAPSFGGRVPGIRPGTAFGRRIHSRARNAGSPRERDATQSVIRSIAAQRRLGVRVMIDCLERSPRPGGVRLPDAACRRIRLRNERQTLQSDLEFLLACRPEVVDFRFAGMSTFPAYEALADEGLVHATVRHTRGHAILLAATSRLLKKPDLRARLFAMRKAAEKRGRRVVLLTARGIRSRTARLAILRSPPATAATILSSALDASV